jgi:hypothetical protein
VKKETQRSGQKKPVMESEPYWLPAGREEWKLSEVANGQQRAALHVRDTYAAVGRASTYGRVIHAEAAVNATHEKGSPNNPL